MTTCWGCTNTARTGLDGFVEVDCMRCMAREIARGPAAAKREADPTLIQAEMRRAWPEEDAYRKGRALVWERIQAGVS